MSDLVDIFVSGGDDGKDHGSGHSFRGERSTAGWAGDPLTAIEIVDDGSDSEPTREYRDDDASYLTWLATHPGGFLINIKRKFTLAGARVHRADCRTIGGRNPHGGVWTGPYVKVCAEQLRQLEQWALEEIGEQIPPCGSCRPLCVAARQLTSESIRPSLTASPPDGRYEMRSSAGRNVVEAWATDYIRFEQRPEWQDRLRTEIRTRCHRLEPSPQQVMHATFFGAKHPNADVENLALYNIGSFKVPGRHGIRFERGTEVPAAAESGDYQFGYRYALEPRSGTFAHWKQTRRLAAFDWTDLGVLAGGRHLAQVWLALASGNAEVFEPAVLGMPFAVRVQVRPPEGHQPVWGGLVKGIFDGVICAFHGHTDTTDLQEVVTRLAAVLPADSAQLEGHLLDCRKAVLGVKPKLVSPYRAGVNGIRQIIFALRVSY